ncbi:MAG: type II toxin-antitoxin system VapC family toxin [Planctomycetes bacterium]|nr:type II toxin-antitoxin system VapC family toxin [Planctomycetota bacterium]
MTKRVYIESTIPSYLAARPSRDLLQAARQQITHDWWNTQRHNYDLCISQTVIDEAEAGDSEAVKRRMPFLQQLPLLDLTEAVNDVAKAIMVSDLLPQKATRDAIHIAVSSVHGIDILLTWNCRHIANAAIMKELGAIVAANGYTMPILCTPEELFGD